MGYSDTFNAAKVLSTPFGSYRYFDPGVLEAQGVAEVSRLPFSIKIMLEALLRNTNGYDVTQEDVRALARWRPDPPEINVPLKLSRVILQDFTGVPAVVDLAALRSAMARFGADPKAINPVVPVDLIIDHSVQVDYFGTAYAFRSNVEKEYGRNHERYTLLKWGQNALKDFRVVPPGTGIVHQVNLEYLAKVVSSQVVDGETYAFPDTLVGTDSHTTMVNGLGVLGWGVGGIEAEAVILGQPYYMLAPRVVGFKLRGALPEGATATDLVLTVTEMLRKHGVVGKFVEYYGPGLDKLALADRATIANMSPEYGATMGFFPVDEETLSYLRLTGRDEAEVALVETYTKATGLFRYHDMPDPLYSETLELDMAAVEPSLAGPKRPQDRVRLSDVKRSFAEHLEKPAGERGFGLSKEALASHIRVERADDNFELEHGSVIIAAITSCTNTSNPSVMLGAGLLAKKAVGAGLRTKPWVKSSLAPGSKVVTDYLDKSGLTPFLEALRFHLVGYGCTTCIGNSGPLPADIASAVDRGDLVAAAVLSGNRNFEGRVNPGVKANYLASPMLVVAYALAGTMKINLSTEPLGTDPNGRDVYLKNIWPTQEEILATVRDTLDPQMFKRGYATVFQGDARWQSLEVPKGEIYNWDPGSTYVQEPPFFVQMSLPLGPVQDIEQARVLAVLGDSLTTDHISPAGAFAASSPAGQYLTEQGVRPADFNSYGSRRGNHQVMMRGSFANIRIKNQMLPGVEGGYTKKLPGGGQMSIYDAAMAYQREGTPLVIIGGKEYGTGSSRDWAAKGTLLLGVKAVIAESFERIHRSNLVGMGVLPLVFENGQNAASLGLDGEEIFDIRGLGNLRPSVKLEVVARKSDGAEVRFWVTARLDTLVEVDYYNNGGILQTVLRRLVKEDQANK